MKQLNTYNKQNTNMIQLEPLFTIEELSKEIGLNKYSIYSKIRKNKFPKGIKVNGKRYFKPLEIKEYYNGMGLEVEIIK